MWTKILLGSVLSVCVVLASRGSASAAAPAKAEMRFQLDRLPSKPAGSVSRFFEKLGGRNQEKSAAAALEGLTRHVTAVNQTWSHMVSNPRAYGSSSFKSKGVSKEQLAAAVPLFKLVYQTDDLASTLSARGPTREMIALSPAHAEQYATAAASLRDTLRKAQTISVEMESSGSPSMVMPFAKFQENISTIVEHLKAVR